MLKTYLEFVKFEHTIFALPFAYVGAILAGQGIPPPAKWFWITLAMVGARTAGMALNRIIDREIDSKNPRTENRPLQKGLLSLNKARWLVFFSVLLLLVAAWQLNPLCLALFPVALLFLSLYSYVKRFHWTTHLVLGSVLACAPVGGWMAISGRLSPAAFLLGAAVLFWVAGFDVIYTCQDVAFDSAYGIHSLPARFGLKPALFLSACFHLTSLGLLAGLGFWDRLGPFFWVGWLGVALILVWEHRLISPEDLSRVNQAFFVMNGWVSVVLFAAVFADRLFT